MSIPEEIVREELVLRRLREDDAPRLQAAVIESLNHLKPWVSWAKSEPRSIEARRELLRGFSREWDQGSEFDFGIFLGERLIGAGGLHRRIETSGLEIGYWIDARYVGRGYATSAAAALTDAAFDLPDITHVEIHHDKANAPSRRIPEKLGFRLVGEEPDEIEAPGESGVSCIWRMERSNWGDEPPRDPPGKGIGA